VLEQLTALIRPALITIVAPQESAYSSKTKILALKNKEETYTVEDDDD
jgi:hypothetical protein